MSLCFRSTKSGLPGSDLDCAEKSKPSFRRSRRTACSGAVFDVLTRDIIAERERATLPTAPRRAFRKAISAALALTAAAFATTKDLHQLADRIVELVHDAFLQRDDG